MLSLFEENEISGKSAENGRTSQLYKIIRNGPVRPVYDSFWTQRPPKVQKICLGSIPQHIRPPRADSRIFAIFSAISSNFASRENPIFLTSESIKMVEKWFFCKYFETFKNFATLAPFWYFYIVRTSNTSEMPNFWNLVVSFSQAMCISLFWKPLIYKIFNIFNFHSY